MGNVQNIAVELKEVERIQKSLSCQVTSLSYVCSQGAMAYVSKLNTTVHQLATTIEKIKERNPYKKSLGNCTFYFHVYDLKINQL